MTRDSRPTLDLDGLLGASEEALFVRLGAPGVDRRAGGERWLVYERADLSVRVRLAAAEGGPHVVRSWTVTFDPGRASLEIACDAVGVTPAPGDASDTIGPHVAPGGASLIRRPLPDGASAATRSLTARLRAGRIHSLTAFDEPPDWRRDPSGA